MKNSKQENQGFTLIEMIGVLAIIGILAAVVAPRVIESIRDAKVTSAIASVNSAKSAALSFYQRYDRFPLDANIGVTTPAVKDYRSDPGGLTDYAVPPEGYDFGDILVRQEVLLETERVPIGEEVGTDTWQVNCVVAGNTGATLTQAGDDVLFKSAGKASRVVYFYMPNLTTQEAASLGTKVNGPFPSDVVGDEGVIAQSTVGGTPSTFIDGANAFFEADGSLYNAYVYVSHQ